MYFVRDIIETSKVWFCQLYRQISILSTVLSVFAETFFKQVKIRHQSFASNSDDPQLPCVFKAAFLTADELMFLKIAVWYGIDSNVNSSTEFDWGRSRMFLFEQLIYSFSVNCIVLVILFRMIIQQWDTWWRSIFFLSPWVCWRVLLHQFCRF